MSGYQPGMDDPDWRRRKKGISQSQDLEDRKRQIMEENGEEFDDDAPDGEEDEAMSTKEQLNEIDEQIAQLKRQRTQLARNAPAQVPSGIGSQIAGAVAAGAKQAAAQQMNELLVGQLKKALVAGNLISEEAANSVGFEIILKIAGPSAILYLAEKFPDTIPQAELIAAGSRLALQAGAAEVVAPMMMLAGPMLKQLASGTAKVQKEIEDASPSSEE